MNEMEQKQNLLNSDLEKLEILSEGIESKIKQYLNMSLVTSINELKNEFEYSLDDLADQIVLLGDNSALETNFTRLNYKIIANTNSLENFRRDIRSYSGKIEKLTNTVDDNSRTSQELLGMG